MATRKITRTSSAPASRTPRVGRRPEHPFNLHTKPFAVVPFMIAPVLPGETLDSGLLQSRVVTDPIKHPLIGWHKEYFWFYVKLRDLDAREAITAALTNPESTMPGALSALDSKYYTAAGGIPWAKLCLQRVIEEYFRDENEAWNSWMIDGYPAAKVRNDMWSDSLMADADFDRRQQEVTGTGEGGAILAEDIDDAMKTWQMLKDNQLTEMTYDDWLRAYGVTPTDSKSAEVKDLHRPEMLRHVREWSYPSNTIDPANGTPRSAVSWSVAARLDKARFFTEPGFILGLTTARPKVFFAGQTGSIVGHMDDAISWLPPQVADNPWKSFINFAKDTGPVPAMVDANGYWIDLKDLFTRGDQFINYPLVATDPGLVALPKPNGQTKYVTDTDVAELFVSTEAATQRVREDGVCQLIIRGRQRDTNPAVISTPPI